MCNTGWEAADILVTLNAAFAEANPAIVAISAVFNPPLIDMAMALAAALDAADGVGNVQLLQPTVEVLYPAQ